MDMELLEKRDSALIPLWVGRRVIWRQHVYGGRYNVDAYVVTLPTQGPTEGWDRSWVGIAAKETDGRWTPTRVLWRNIAENRHGKRAGVRTTHRKAVPRPYVDVTDGLDDLASERGLRVYGTHYLNDNGWMLQKPNPDYECGNCRSTSMTSACWCRWEPIAVGRNAIRAYLS